jgi:Ser-tRNA(Ala) deacylase AlaX
VKEVFSYKEAVEKGLIPETFKTPLVRIVHFATSNCPCGGTHVENTA